MQSLAARVRELLPAVEAKMLKMEQAECPVFHRFGPGIYIRELHMRAGTFAIGHYQRERHVNIMLAGRVMMLNEDGKAVEHRAPLFYVGEPGRKVGYVLEDMVWQNVYATEETDIEKLEERFLEKSDVFLEEVQGVDKLFAARDREDYEAFLKEWGLSAEYIRQVSEDDSDAIELPNGTYKFQVGNSPIEGKGLFATADIEQGEDIAPARIEGKRTLAGRYTNHAKEPNAVMVSLYGVDGDKSMVILRAIKPIKGRRGGQQGEEITVDYRQVLQLNMGET